MNANKQYIIIDGIFIIMLVIVSFIYLHFLGLLNSELLTLELAEVLFYKNGLALKYLAVGITLGMLFVGNIYYNIKQLKVKNDRFWDDDYQNQYLIKLCVLPLFIFISVIFIIIIFQALSNPILRACFVLSIFAYGFMKS